MQVVSLRKCVSYDADVVEKALDSVLADLGGLDKFVKPNMNVLIKPNLLIAKKPERHATTHPAIVEAVAKKCVALGAQVVIADSPGGPSSLTWVKRVYAATGMTAAAKNAGAQINLDTSSRDVYYPDARILKKFKLCDFTAKADCIINIAKLKAHGFMWYTGAVKNLFGCIPGITKAEYHARMSATHDFSEMLVDLACYVKPAINIIDAVIGMEGNGPSAGDLKEMGFLLASEDAFAVDETAVRLIGYEPKEIFTTARAIERGLVTDIDIVGENIEDNIVKNFKIPASGLNGGEIHGFTGTKLLSKLLASRPVINTKKCTSCGICAENCPPKAIDMQAKAKPVIDHGKCIKCFCCQELCPKEAIRIRRTFLSK